MKQIIKNSRQPDFFKEWKRRYQDRTGQSATYKALYQEHHEYLKIKRLLINEQYHLCCYCCNRITEENSHIDHFIPQSIDHSKQLDYQNMFTSCNGYYEGISTVDQETCGHHRKNWYERDFIVSPLDNQCEIMFEFLADGSILANNSDEERANKMIEHFGLDSYALRKAREAAINTAYENIGFYNATLDDSVLQSEIQFNMNPNSNTELPPFCDAVLYILKQL